MTVSSTSRSAGPFSGNGVTTAFPFTFKVFQKSDVQVTLTNTATGVQTVLLLDSDYSVTLNVNQDANPGGTITYPVLGSPLPAGQTLFADGSLLELQGTDIGNASRFLPQVLEDALDYLVILIQQVAARVARAIKAPVGDDPVNLILPIASKRANKTLSFDDAGNVVAVATASDAQAATTLALQYRNEAQGFRNGALTAELAAELAESNAEGAQALTEAARDSLLAAADIYVDTVAGLAATPAGGYFWVPSPNANESYILYRDVAGVATEIKRLPSASAFTGLAAVAVPGARYAIQDGSDNADLYVDDAGIYATTFDVDTVNGFARNEITRAVRRPYPNMTAAYVGVISYGQSLSVGANAAVHSRADVGDGFFDSVRFVANGSLTAGPRAQDGSGSVAQNHASFVPYVEQVNGGGFGETPLGNALRMIKTLIRTEDRIAHTAYDYILVGSAPGQANIAIAGLVKGTGFYQRVIDDVTYGRANAIAQGKGYAVDVVYWSQGEADIQQVTSRAAYKNAFLQLYTDLNADIKAITGQSHDIKIIGYQVSMWDQFSYTPLPLIPLAQLDAAKANPNIILATCVYAVEHVASNDAHLTGFGSAHLGAYYGYCHKRVVLDGETWQMAYPRRLTRQQNILEIEMPDTGYPWAISDTLFPTQPNAGFTALRADGVTANVITSVSVVAPRRVRIVLTNAEAGTLHYGFANMGGNLHDLCDVDPLTAREGYLYRPCLTFEETYA